jgi:lipid II:glycine glycyltransferase (peptidoglycan interpeptide bridge formation enzyme)
VGSEVVQRNLEDYSIEVDAVRRDSWDGVLREFKDANIYQTWEYGAARFGENSLSHMIVKRNDQIVGAVQTRILKIPVINAGIAYMRWGPLCRRRDSEDNLDDLSQIVAAMRREYVDRRGLYLRIIPNEIRTFRSDLRSVLQKAGFEWHKSDYRTLYLNLDETLEAIRSNMSKNWRKHLNKAEKLGLVVTEGTDQDLFQTVEGLYRETLQRKGFVPGINIDEYHSLQECLPDYLKMHIMICRYDGRPIAGLVGSSIGDVGIELVAATGNNGLEVGGSYLLRWRMVEYLKRCGCHFYNLNGINPERNPGGYQFKSGLCGKNGLDDEFIGIFDTCKNPFSYWAVRLGDTARLGYRKAKEVRTRLQRDKESKN